MPKPSIIIPAAQIILYSDSIIELKLIGRDPIKIEDGRQIIEGFNKINPSRQTKGYIVNLNHITYISKNARDYLRVHSELESQIAAVALLAQNPLARILGSFFLGLNQPDDVEVKMIKSYGLAVKWLNQKMGEIKTADPELDEDTAQEVI